MPKSSVVARVLEGDRIECRVVTHSGKELTLSGTTSDVEPDAAGPTELTANPALVLNAWAFAKFTYLKVNLPTANGQSGAEKRAAFHRGVAEWIADLADEVTETTKVGWCSSCFAEAEHRKVKRPAGHLAAYLCGECGAPTLPCAAPSCKYMAVRRRGPVRVPRYCAEHRHDVPSFEKVSEKLDSLVDYRDLFAYDEPNLSKWTKIAGVGLVGFAGAGALALAAAPAVGGAIGSLVGGYTGAAASSYGLALLGGGAVASGGLGMTGGTAVVAAMGGLLGGSLSASITNVYVREDKSFHIEMLKGGSGSPVVICNGFLSESGKGWGDWKQLVTTRYPDSPVYRVHWGAKELKDLGILASSGAVKVASQSALKSAAMTATKAGAKKLGPLGPALVAADLVKNPWHVAKSRADKTGVVVADLLARTNEASYVLVGHSLGARVMAVAAQTLGTKSDGPRIEAAHLTGAAIGAKSDWHSLTARVDQAVYNYHSVNDNVLKYLYGVAQGGQTAAGLKGFSSDSSKLKNIDVSDHVERHSDYYTNVTFVGDGQVRAADYAPD